MTDLSPSRATGALDGLLVAALALAVYAAGGRDGFHGIDAHYLLWRAHGGFASHEYHTFYLPALIALRSVAAPFGATLFDTALGLSALGAALGVLAAHTASRILGSERRDALFVSLLVAALPAVALFGMIVEVHGLALACSGIAWIAIAWWQRAPSPLRAAVVGVALVVAFLAHPTAAALGGTMVVVHALRPAPVRSWPLLRDGSIALALLVAGIVFAPPLLRSLGGGTSAGFALGYLTTEAPRHATGYLLAKATAVEWLLGMLPTGLVLPFVALRRPSLRPAAIAALAATVPFVVTAWLMLEEHEFEFGAYTSAIAWPTALVVVAGIRTHAARIAMVAVAAVATALLVARYREHPRTVMTAALVRSIADGRDVLWLIGDSRDFEAWLVHHGHAEAVMLSDLLAADLATTAALLPVLDAELGAREAAGTPVIATSNAFRLFEEPGVPGGVANPLRAWLVDRGLQPTERGEPTGARLRATR